VIYDYCVIGGGIVGMSTAMSLLRQRPGARLVLVEKEAGVARHQTGHNSGVIHSGIYYEPGSLKAELCRQGARATKEFCAKHHIDVAVPGKLLVASDTRDAARMDALQARAGHNGIDIDRLSATDLGRLEPHVQGVGALHVKETGIVDYTSVCLAMETTVREAGGEIETGAAVTAIRESAGQVVVQAGERRWTARRLVACAGLQADRVARMAGVATTARIIPFRGEYYRLPETRSGIVTRLIYPIPDPDLPFLGVHLTPMIDGTTSVGPNAVLGLSREGYPRLSFTLRDVRDIVTFPGFWRVAATHARTGVLEVRNSLFKRGYLAACRRYCPDLQMHDLLPMGAGIRAQAVLADGTLLHDFAWEQTDRTLHVINAPSPAATSAIPIGNAIATRVLAVG